MDLLQHPEDRPHEEPILKSGMAFLAENPEAFGFVPDACPVVTRELLIAANGHSAEGGAISPAYPVEEAGVEGLLDDPFAGLLPRTDGNAALLRATFGESEARQEHLVSRYCAALAEATALQILDGAAKGASLEQTCTLLGDGITRKLDGLRTVLRDRGEFSAQEAVFFTVSLGVCRVTEEGEGDYLLDVFSAGDFRVYLLDAEGMCPLWLTDAPVLSPDSPTVPLGRRVRLHHPEPFAVLLLSDSICALNAAEHRSLREAPGLIWRYRMRLEDHFLRLITSCVREQEFGERAARFFTGRSNGRDSASGAMMILRGDTSYEVFRTACRSRLGKLEGMISLLPEGYDPGRVVEQASLADTERAYVRKLLEREAGLSERVTEALCACALEKLRCGEPAETTPPPDVPEYQRLTWATVMQTYRIYDAENDDDRARVEENREILREGLADHWITLRPIFLDSDDSDDVADPTHSYRACLDMNGRLGVMRAERAHILTHLEKLLSDGLAVLHSEGNDWLCGRAGDDSITAWTRILTDDLPSALAPLRRDWQADTARYRSLLAAYTAERENLFCRDAEADSGLFAADWRAIMNGALPESRWEELRARLYERRTLAPEIETYVELLDALHRISLGTGALLTRIRSRSADRRMARDLANRAELQIACLRASAYEDPDWGEAVLSVMDDTMRHDFRAVVRRWQEKCELNKLQAETYATYKKMYETYGVY